MDMSTLLAAHPWIPLVAVIIFFAVLVGYSIHKGHKGEIPMDLENPHADKRRPDVGSTDSRIMPRNGS
jgi:hypothetical protein